MRAIPPSIEFYADVLAFRVDYVYGVPPFHAQLSRDGVALNLRRKTDPPWPAPPPEPDLLAVRFEVDDVRALYLEVRERGARLHHPLRREPWGQRTFVVADPDGNLLSFGSHMPVTPPPEGPSR
ncbi:VOC family protein [Euzebya sp.]|uniref:VOC family protein n=1 Tax=Euzebya sp. TaxID=1971409 RepID=UPI003517E08F